MNDLSHFLHPSSIKLSLSTEKEEEVIDEVLDLLKDDERISNWDEFLKAIKERPSFPISVSKERAIVIYHGRTTVIQDLVMSLGRSKKGIIFEESQQRVHLIFTIGVPTALNHEYLRIVGAIARACKDPTILEKILVTESSDKMIELLNFAIQ